MSKKTILLTVLILVITGQFVMSVIGKSIAVQHSTVLVDRQKQLATLEAREAELIDSIARNTALTHEMNTETGYVAITKPVPITVLSQVASR